MDSQSQKKSIFVTPDGKNLVFTFTLVSSLFLLWGFCNGMIDVMDKHFQEELHLSLSQSAWVQFAHYLGYFLMSLPAGILASRLGYKWGILAGLSIVGMGGLWFLPATHIAQFWAFLLGVCLIASGLTFLETVANPYTTVLGHPQYAATRINLAQSCNGVGWMLGPIAGGIFFYGKDVHGQSTGSQTLYIPYVAVAAVVLVLAVIFFLGPVPDIKTEDDYAMDKGDNGQSTGTIPDRELNRGLIYFLLLLNATVLVGIIGMILWLVLSVFNFGQGLIGLASSLPHSSGTPLTPASSLLTVICAIGVTLVIIAAVVLIPVAGKISHHSIWSHPHFSGATLAQFFYVAAQAGIFSFLVNYMTSQVPAIPQSWNDAVAKMASHSGFLQDLMTGWFEFHKPGVLGFSDRFAAWLASLGFVCFLIGRFSGAWLLKKCAAHSILGLYGILNVIVCLLIFCKLGWLSVGCVFASYFFMSIMFPTIFALGIHGLGVRAKKASAFLVMAIMGGAILPKLMGYVADQYDMSRGFIVPAVCFALIAIYSFAWPALSKIEAVRGLSAGGGH